MPLCGRKRFHPLPIPEGIGPNTYVFYLPLTSEVFLDYDAYFERVLHLNAAVWSCAVTEKPGLTFSEAVEHEAQSLQQIDTFPASLQLAILFMVHKFSGRTRLEDLVNDIAHLVKDRFFIGEELVYKMSSGRKRTVRVLDVRYDKSFANVLSNGKSSRLPLKAIKSEDDDNNGDKKGKVSLPEIPPADCYRYEVEMLGDFSQNCSDSEENQSNVQDDGGRDVWENVRHTQLSRLPSVGTKLRLKMIVKYFTTIIGRKLDVKKDIAEQLNLSFKEWSSVFAGPHPIFPQTLRPENVSSKKSLIKEVKSERMSVDSKKQVRETPKQAKPSDVTATPTSKNLPSTSKQKEDAKMAAAKSRQLKLEQQIRKQQSDLAYLFAMAERSGLENLERWKQTAVILSDKDIENLKTKTEEAMKQKKESEKRELIEKRKREREEVLERKKPRDDLQCDDLKPLPRYDPFLLPEWIPKELYSDLLSVNNFLCCFGELLFTTGKSTISLNQLAKAMVIKRTDNTYLVKAFRVLMRSRDECALEEDGGDADPNRCDDGHESQLSILDNVQNMEQLRNALSTLTTPVQRITLMNVLIQQLLSYRKYRELMDSRFTHLLELKRELRNLREMDRLQERDSREIHTAKDNAAKMSNDETENDVAASSKGVTAKDGMDTSVGNTNSTKKKSPVSKELQILRDYLRCMNEGRRSRFINESDIKRMLLDKLPYEEMDGNEIEEFRQMQRETMAERQAELLKEIFVMQARVGLSFMGKDRAFRSYFFMHSHGMILVERPNVDEVIESCAEPTPIAGTNAENEDELNEERIRRLGCTGWKSSNCPVHCWRSGSPSAQNGEENSPQFYYYLEEDGIQKLLDSLNPRGFREMELADNVQQLKSVYAQRMNKVAEKRARYEGENFVAKHLDLVAELNEREEEDQLEENNDTPFMQNSKNRNASASASSTHSGGRNHRSTARYNEQQEDQEDEEMDEDEEENEEDEEEGNSEDDEVTNRHGYCRSNGKATASKSNGLGNGNVSERVLRQRATRKRPATNDYFNYRHLSMGLRESDDHRKEKLKCCEKIIREALRQDFSEQFALPVDIKLVPNYYEVIKNPMDMGKIINKLKNFDYDTAREVWADCELMFANCEEFNDEDSHVCQEARLLRDFLQPRFESVLND